MVWLSFHFLYFVVSSPGGRLSVVGFFVLQYRFSLGIFGTICGFVCNELLILFFYIGFPWLYLALYAVLYVMSC